MEVGSETVPWIEVKELMVHKAYLSQVVNEEKSWFTRMEVLDRIYHQLFFTANISRCQPTTSPYLQPLAPQTLALAATAVYCALSEYTRVKKTMGKFSQDEYRATIGRSPEIDFAIEATTQ
jgi:hypothetical protein